MALCPCCGQPTNKTPPGIKLTQEGCEIDGVSIALTVDQDALFRELLRRSGECVTVEQIYFAIHDPEAPGDGPTMQGSVFSAVWRLRKKLSAGRFEVGYVPGRGYRLTERREKQNDQVRSDGRDARGVRGERHEGVGVIGDRSAERNDRCQDRDAGDVRDIPHDQSVTASDVDAFDLELRGDAWIGELIDRVEGGGAHSDHGDDDKPGDGPLGPRARLIRGEPQPIDHFIADIADGKVPKGAWKI